MVQGRISSFLWRSNPHQGFHNWVYFYHLEKRGQVEIIESDSLVNLGSLKKSILFASWKVVQPNLQVNYLGHWESPNLGNHGTGLSFTFKLVASYYTQVPTCAGGERSRSRSPRWPSGPRQHLSLHSILPVCWPGWGIQLFGVIDYFSFKWFQKKSRYGQGLTLGT